MMKEISPETKTSEKPAGAYSVTMVIIALLAISVEPIIVKLGYNASATAFQMLVVKTLVGALIIFPFAGITRSFRWAGKDLGKLLWVSFLFIITNVLVFVSLRHLPAVTVITIVTATPAFVALVNQKMGRDVLETKFWIGFFMSFFGVLLTIQAFRPGAVSMSLEGLIYISLSIVTSTLYRTRMDVLTREFSPTLVTNYIFMINGILSLLCIPFLGKVPVAVWPLGGWMGFAAVIGNLAFLSAIRILGSTRVSIFGILQRPLIIFASAIILRESLTFWQIMGILLVIVGVYMAKVKRTEQMKLNPAREMAT